MKFLFLLFLFTLSNSKSPKIDVFYESLCLECQSFITDSFKKYLDYNHLGLAEVNFIPYGKAKEKYDETAKKYIFTCQNGENECYGNLIETCAIDIMGRFSSYNLIYCLDNEIPSLEEDFDKALDICMKDKSLKKIILDCAKGEKGNLLEHKMGELTPKVDYVPWITVDGEHDFDTEGQILNDIVEYLCGLPGSECDH